MPASTRGRIIDAGTELFRRQGYMATGVKQITLAADAQFASLYHFFPGGKEELGAEVIRSAGGLYQQIWERILDDAPDVITGVRKFFHGAAMTLLESGYADACPIATVALEVASTSEPLRQATADVFESWIVAGARRFQDAGMGPDEAREVSIAIICALEGAFVLCRATRSTAPMEIAGAGSVAMAEAALGAISG